MPRLKTRPSAATAPEAGGAEGAAAAAAREAARESWRQGSRPARGAAIVTGSGRIFAAPETGDPGDATGGCAERTAILLVRMAGGRRLARLVLRGGRDGRGEAGPPCGACLQVLFEFSPSLRVDWGTVARPRSSTVRELLPGAFGRADLARADRSGP